MKSTTKRSRRKTQQEAARERRHRDPESDGEEKDTEIIFHPSGPAMAPPTPTPLSPPDSPNTSAELQYEVVLDMVQQINSELGLINLAMTRSGQFVKNCSNAIKIVTAPLATSPGW